MTISITLTFPSRTAAIAALRLLEADEAGQLRHVQDAEADDPAPAKKRGRPKKAQQVDDESPEESPTEVSTEELRSQVAAAVDRVGVNAVRTLLSQFKVARASELPPEKRADFVAALRSAEAVLE